MTSVGRSPDLGENIIEDAAILEDTFSATSTSCTSCSYISYNTMISDTQSYIQPTQGHSHDCLEHLTGTDTNIGSISVQNSTDVTIGNKNFFNGNVVIKHLVVDYGESNADPSKSIKKATQAKSLLCRRILRSFGRHPRFICSFIATLAVVVVTFIVTAYFLDFFGECEVELTTCVEGPSVPSHYDCGYSSGCSQCIANFPEKEVCESYYERNCGRVRCFCKPHCLNADCDLDPY